MNSQNFTKDNNIQQTPQTVLSKAREHQLARELMGIQPQSGCVDATQPRIMRDNSQFQEKHLSTEDLCLGSMSKALRDEKIKLALDEEAVSTQIAGTLIGESTKLDENIASYKDYDLDSNISMLLAKFQQYQEKILNDTRLERELNLFVEPLTIHHDSTTGEDKLLELSNETRRYILNSESSIILLLTGQPGAGKSFFCQHLQRQILSNWSKNPESDDDENWFPIYVEFSSLKNPKSEAISEALARELSLTEEEISFLKTTDQTNPKLPRLLFIFDGYDEIEDIHAFHMLDSKEELMKHNFFERNKIHDDESWKNAKFIITCREENLQKVQRKELLFGPVSADSGSFLERRVEPFSDEQIRCYLKKYCIFEQFSLLPALVSCLPSDLSQKLRSWEEVRLLEHLIDCYTLREIARVPSMLRIICRSLPKITLEDFKQRGAEDSTQTKILSNRFLLDFFVSETIKTNLKKTSETTDNSKNQEESKGDLEAEKENQKVDAYIEAINRQAQNFALRSGGYSVNEEVKAQGEVIDDSFTLKLYPLAKWDGNRSRVKFQYPWICEFYIAKSIEEEIREKVPSFAVQDGKLEIPRNLLISQRLLTEGASNSMVLLLLRDAVRDKRLTTEQLIKLVKISRQKGGVEQESDFAVAAANAITVLNAVGYDFSHQDLSSITIPGANLSYGMFEGTNFKNANLREVNLTEAWLKNANLGEVHLANVDFGETGLRLRNEQIFNIAYSFDRKYLAVDVGDQTVIFENVGPRQNNFKEIRRVPGGFLDCPFHMDGKQIVTVIKKGNLNNDHHSFCFWDVISCKCVEKLEIPMGNNTLIKFNPKRKEVIALDGKEVKKYSTVTGSWTKFSLTALNDAEDWKLNAEDCDTLLASDSRKKLTTLCSAITGKLILTLKQETTSCQFSTDGKQIILRLNDRVIQVVDSMRGYHMKTLASEQLNYLSLRLIGRRFLAAIGRELVFQDVSSAQTYLKIPLKNTSQDRKDKILINYSTNQVAYFSENPGVVYFEQLPTTTVLPAPTITLRGTNNKGLNLQGVIAGGCDKLSEKNIMIFQKKGDYGTFPETVLNKLLPSNSEEFNDVREVIAIDERLAPIHAQIIGSNTYWSNLRKLDLSRNAIEEEGGEAIGGNKAWPHLEELTLTQTQIGDKTTIKVANNHIWKNMKKLELASNNIGDIAAREIGKSKIWVNLEVLNLQQNEIEDEGARTIGENNTWEKLKRLDLSSNKINEKQTIISLCGNGSWKDLKYLFLRENQAVLDATDALKAIGGVVSKSLEKIDLPRASFKRVLLQCLKYYDSESVVELPLSDNGYKALHAGIIGLNTTWTNLQTLILENNSIGHEGATALSKNTTWSSLRTLNLGYNSIGDKGVTALSQNTTWINLQTLNLEQNSIGDKGATALSKNTIWINLETLYLGGNSIGYKGAIALSQNTTWINLQTLDLEQNSIGDKGATALSQNTTWINLQTLNLGINSIGDKGVTALSQNLTWINLQTLDLGINSIGAKGATALTKNTAWINLQTLDLRDNSIHAEGGTALSQNTTWINLQTLNLELNSIGAEGATALSKNKIWINLQTLNFGENKIGDKGATVLSQNTTWTNLQSLDLEQNSIGDKGAAALSNNINWINLQTLNLGINSISDKGATALSQNTTWISLQTLDLRDNSIHEEGAIALSKNKIWINLQTLNLGINSIGDEGATALSKNTTWINLQTLNLERNTIGDKGATALSKNTTWINLQTLNLERNTIGDKGATALSQNTTWINLQALDLRDNSIHTEGATALSQNTTWTNLQTLNLERNTIGDKGATALSKNTTWTSLQTLDLRENEIGDKGATALSQNTTWINLQILDLRQNPIGYKGATALSQNTTWTNLQILDLNVHSIGHDWS